MRNTDRISMRLFVSKLSLENCGNPRGKKLYKKPCKFYEEDGEIEEYLDENETDESEENELKPINMKILLKEFRSGRLRQGWGVEDGVYNTDLRESFHDKNGRIQPNKKWVCDFMHLYDVSQEEAIGRFRIISKLLDMKEGSIVFVPNIPSEYKFSVATVNKKCYKFSQIKGYLGFGHIIHVKDVEEYSYGDDTLPKKIWSFPPAVVRIRKNDKFKKFLEESYFK